MDAMRILGLRGRLGVAVAGTTLVAVTAPPPGRAHGVRTVQSKELPAGTITDGAVADRTSFCASLMALRRDRRLPRSVVMAVGAHDVVVRTMELPVLSVRNVHSAARFELSDQLPFPVADALVDCRRLGEPRPDGSADYLVVAIRLDAARELSATLRAAGFELSAVDVPALAAVRADMLANHATNQSAGGRAGGDVEDSTAVVVPGDGQLTIGVHTGGRLRFARTVHLASGPIGGLGTTIEAELSALGSLSSGPDTPVGLHCATDPLVEAVLATLEHHASMGDSLEVRRVHVLGPSPAGLLEALDNRGGLVVEERQPILSSDGAEVTGIGWLAAGHVLAVPRSRPELRVPYGLAPSSGRATSTLRSAGAAAALGAVVGTVGLVTAGPDPQPAAAERRVLEQAVDELQAELDAAEDIDARAGQLAQLERRISQLRSARPGWPTVLGALESGAPGGSSLVSVDTVAPSRREAGSIRLTVEAADASAVPAWLDLLGRIDGLSTPWLEGVVAGTPDVVGAPTTFTIVATLVDDAASEPGGSEGS